MARTRRLLVAFCYFLLAFDWCRAQHCLYPFHKHVRLPGIDEKTFRECVPSGKFELKDCPGRSEYDLHLQACRFEEGDEDEKAANNNAEPTGHDRAGKWADGDQARIPNGPSVIQYSNQPAPWFPPVFQVRPELPVEVLQNCVLDGWCPHDPKKLQYCDLNGQQFLQCSASGWVLKNCPYGTRFVAHLGRCGDPRETVDPMAPFPSVAGFSPGARMGGQQQQQQLGSNALAFPPGPAPFGQTAPVADPSLQGDRKIAQGQLVFIGTNPPQTVNNQFPQPAAWPLTADPRPIAPAAFPSPVAAPSTWTPAAIPPGNTNVDLQSAGRWPPGGGADGDPGNELRSINRLEIDSNQPHTKQQWVIGGNLNNIPASITDVRELPLGTWVPAAPRQQTASWGQRDIFKPVIGGRYAADSTSSQQRPDDDQTKLQRRFSRSY